MKKLFLLFLLMSCSLCINAQEEDPDVKYASELLKKGDAAPDFIIANGDTLVGRSLSSLRGKYVVLDFWATWCPDCRKDVPAMKKLYRRYASKDVVFVSISFDKDKDVWQKYIRENGMPWIHHSELKPWKETKISEDYHIKWIPAMYLLDKDGKVMLGTVCVDKLEKSLKDATSVSPEMYVEYLNSVFETRYDGGMNGFRKSVKKNLQYPDMAKNMLADGQVIIHFTLNPDGSLSDISATGCKILHYDEATLEKYMVEQREAMYKECARQFAKEGARVIRSTKGWKADRKSKPVKLFFMVEFNIV